MSAAQIAALLLDGLPVGVTATIFVLSAVIWQLPKLADAIARLRMAAAVIRQLDGQAAPPADLARMVETVMGVAPPGDRQQAHDDDGDSEVASHRINGLIGFLQRWRKFDKPS